MTYALVISNTVQAESNNLPASARRLDTGAWVMGLATAPVALQQACGYYQVVDTARPADTQTDTYDRTITLPAGVPTVTWVQRAKTAGELAADTSNTNNTTLRTQADAAIEANIAYLAIGTPTNLQVIAQVRALTRHINGVIRLVIGKLDSTSGT